MPPEPGDPRLALVERFFQGTGDSYDCMVDAATFGIDRLWKRRIAQLVPARSRRVADLACGTARDDFYSDLIEHPNVLRVRSTLRGLLARGCDRELLTGIDRRGGCAREDGARHRCIQGQVELLLALLRRETPWLRASSLFASDRADRAAARMDAADFLDEYYHAVEPRSPRSRIYSHPIGASTAWS